MHTGKFCHELFISSFGSNQSYMNEVGRTLTFCESANHLKLILCASSIVIGA
nr:MAG: hypothetical protein EDM05_32450 [Leptolyngbya sp. IPPAS B-1204]